RYFDWFRNRTSVKLPGSFFSDFWATFVMQASVSEPAVWHAVLALSSVHRIDVLNDGNRGGRENGPDEQEQFTLQHYVKAISHLQPHFSARDKASVRVALITCIVFVSVDLLRDHILTAKVHLRSGMKLLQETLSPAGGRDGPLLMPGRGSIDNSIMEAFFRINVQVDIFKQFHEHIGCNLEMAVPERLAFDFCSVKQAWIELQRPMTEIFHLAKRAHAHDADFAPLPYPSSLLKQQHSIQEDLAGWSAAFEASRGGLLANRSLNDQKVYLLLSIYHTMMDIMAKTCLPTGDESAFDLCADQFIDMIKRLADIRIVGIAIFALPPSSSIHAGMGRSVLDLGWLPPLYYIAIKCRIHRVRLHAVRLLESCGHKEGFFDARITAIIARKVMELEERDYYQEYGPDHDFPLTSYPTLQEMGLPTLPEKYRLCEVKIVLSGEPTDKISLFCKRRKGKQDCRIHLADHNISSHRWVDVVDIQDM
ncbi:hypothetical protein GQ53DRAFT_643376, partial [Thozetella sp. PMI_491]